jgi:Asp-tRNA(Asn)/Glu-tRNA(Gln) amidotransferase A subunit family amidase
MSKPIKQTGTILGAVEEARSMCEELLDELQNWYDNMPEQFQNGEKGSQLEEAIRQLEEAAEELGEVDDLDYPEIHNFPIEYMQTRYSKSTYMSRAKRLGMSACGLQGIPKELPEDFKGDEEAHAAFEEVLNWVAEAIETIESVDFPAMRG